MKLVMMIRLLPKSLLHCVSTENETVYNVLIDFFFAFVVVLVPLLIDYS